MEFPASWSSYKRRNEVNLMKRAPIYFILPRIVPQKNEQIHPDLLIIPSK